MNVLPFLKAKNGFQFAGSGFDTSGGGGGSSLPDFSTDEQDTGLKWVDGSTIYSKTFAFDSGSSNAQIVINDALPSGYYVLFGLGAYKNSTYTTRFRPVDFTNWEIDSGGIYINISQFGSNVTGYITIFYTK